MKSPLRKRIGKIKALLIDRLPYAHVASKVPKWRSELRSLVDVLTPIVPGDRVKYEVHMLCGKRDVDMGILASWSLMRFMDGEGKLILHSDGTIDHGDFDRWKTVVGQMDLIGREESGQRSREVLCNAEELYQWRCSNWASAQLVDTHLYGDCEMMLIMDSDVLVFEKPLEVLKRLEESPGRLSWCKDILDAYSGPTSLLKEITGISPPARLCAGFLATPRFSQTDFEELNRWMLMIKKDNRIEVGHFWSCQTYYALLCSRYPQSEMLPAAYNNTMTKTAPSQIMRHYVGVPRVRFRYFTEGCTRITQQLDREITGTGL